MMEKSKDNLINVKREIGLNYDYVSNTSISVTDSSTLSDDHIMKLSVPELNRITKNLSHEEVLKIKQRRRTLKNRGYAASCRVKQLSEKQYLENKKNELRKDVERIAKENLTINAELESLQNKFEDLVKFAQNLQNIPSNSSNNGNNNYAHQ